MDNLPRVWRLAAAALKLVCVLGTTLVSLPTADARPQAREDPTAQRTINARVTAVRELLRTADQVGGDAAPVRVSQPWPNWPNGWGNWGNWWRNW